MLELTKFKKIEKSLKNIILVHYKSLWKSRHCRKCFLYITEKVLKWPFFIWIFVLHMSSIYFVTSKISNFYFVLFLKSLDKVVMEMSTCEEPRAPNGPSPIATASGQRSVRSKMVWNYIKQIDCKFSKVYMVAACHSHLLQNFILLPVCKIV